jgi:hypothetical protein
MYVCRMWLLMCLAITAISSVLQFAPSFAFSLLFCNLPWQVKLTTAPDRHPDSKDNSKRMNPSESLSFSVPEQRDRSWGQLSSIRLICGRGKDSTTIQGNCRSACSLKFAADNLRLVESWLNQPRYQHHRRDLPG